SVTYKLKEEPDPVSGDPTRITASLLAPYGQGLNGAQINIAAQPANVAALQNRTATLTVNASASYLGDTTSASPGLAYQWQSAPAGSTTFTNIGGATGSSYTTPLVGLSAQATQYRVNLLSGDTNVFSSAATLSVTPDTVGPQGFQV